MSLIDVDAYFLESRPMVADVLGDSELFSDGFGAAWEDMLHVWCGMPL